MASDEVDKIKVFVVVGYCSDHQKSFPTGYFTISMENLHIWTIPRLTISYAQVPLGQFQIPLWGNSPPPFRYKKGKSCQGVIITTGRNCQGNLSHRDIVQVEIVHGHCSVTIHLQGLQSSLSCDMELSFQLFSEQILCHCLSEAPS